MQNFIMEKRSKEVKELTYFYLSRKIKLSLKEIASKEE